MSDETGNRGGEASSSSPNQAVPEPISNEHTAKWKVYTTMARRLAGQVRNYLSPLETCYCRFRYPLHSASADSPALQLETSKVCSWRVLLEAMFSASEVLPDNLIQPVHMHKQVVCSFATCVLYTSPFRVQHESSLAAEAPIHTTSLR